MTKYWKEVMFKDEIIAEITNDGLLYRFKDSIIRQKLTNLPSDKKGWFFNESRDRYCAENTFDGFITVNPSKVVDLFGYPIILT